MDYLIDVYPQILAHCDQRDLLRWMRVSKKFYAIIDGFNFEHSTVEIFRNGYFLEVRKLIKCGFLNWIPGLCHACYGGHLPLIRLMISLNMSDADNIREAHIANIRRYEVFKFACNGGHISAVRLLIENGITDWNSGLMGACEGGHLEIVQLMLDNGANELDTGLWRACIGTSREHTQIVDLLIAHGARNWDQGLCGACRGGNTYMINFMIARGANNWNGGLGAACAYGQLRVAQLMIARGADDWNWGLTQAYHSRYNVQNHCDICNSIQIANIDEYTKIIKLMIKHGATHCNYCTVFHKL